MLKMQSVLRLVLENEAGTENNRWMNRIAEILEEIPSEASGGHLFVKTVEKVRELL